MPSAKACKNGPTTWPEVSTLDLVHSDPAESQRSKRLLYFVHRHTAHRHPFLQENSQIVSTALGRTARCGLVGAVTPRLNGASINLTTTTSTKKQPSSKPRSRVETLTTRQSPLLQRHDWPRDLLDDLDAEIQAPLPNRQTERQTGQYPIVYPLPCLGTIHTQPRQP